MCKLRITICTNENKSLPLQAVMRKIAFCLAALMALGVQAAEENDTVKAPMYRLFVPLTFYHSVAGHQLSLTEEEAGEVGKAVDKALMDIYLKRPDLIQNTETQMEEGGTLRSDLDEPIVQKVELVEQVEPQPEAPVIDEPMQLVVTKPSFWTFKGDGSLQFMQNFVSGNWYKGGESNYSAVGALTLEANYDNKQRWKWDNKLELKLGMQTSRSDKVHKVKSNEDLIRYTGKVGLQASKRWYYTLQVLAYTQFTHGLKANDTKVYSAFMSPLNLNVGLGMDYKVEWMNKKLTGTVNLAPVALNYRYVKRSWFDDEQTQWFPSRYGIEENKHSLLDIGSQVTASLEWKLNDVVTWKSRIYGFTSYKRFEFEWENTFNLKVSRFITATIFLFPRFDDANKRDDSLGYWQFKEYSSLGFSYSF